MSSPRVTFNLTCGKGVTELQNLTNLLLSSFAESHQMQQKNFDVSPNSPGENCGPRTALYVFLIVFNTRDTKICCKLLLKLCLVCCTWGWEELNYHINQHIGDTY